MFQPKCGFIVVPLVPRLCTSKVVSLGHYGVLQYGGQLGLEETSD